MSLDPLPCKDGTYWTPDAETEAFLLEQYLNLGQQWREMLIWLTLEDDRRKTRRGMKRFVGRWMRRSGVLRPPKPKAVHNVIPIDRQAGRERMAEVRRMLK